MILINFTNTLVSNFRQSKLARQLRIKILPLSFFFPAGKCLSRERQYVLYGTVRTHEEQIESLLICLQAVSQKASCLPTELHLNRPETLNNIEYIL